MNILRWVLAVLAVVSSPLVAFADVYVANFENASVTVYATTATGDVAPIRSISGPNTLLVNPVSVTVDTVHSELYVADFFGQAVRVYPLGANGDVAPSRNLLDGPNSGLSQPRMVAVDTAHDEIIVASINDSVRTYSRTASDDAAPSRVLAGITTKLNNPITVVLDSLNDEIITNSYDVGGSQVPGILVFDRTASGDVAPKRTIAGNNTQMGTFTNYTALDVSHNEIFTQAVNGEGVAVFARTANGDVPPIRLLHGWQTGFPSGYAGAIAIDTVNDRLLVSSPNFPRVASFPRTADGNELPLQGIEGPATGLAEPFGLAIDASGGFSLTGGLPPPISPIGATAVPALSPLGLGISVLALCWLGWLALRRKSRLSES